MLIQKYIRPDSIVAYFILQLLRGDFCNKIGQKRKSSRRAQVVRFASESGLNRLSNRADRKVAMILLLAKACTNYFEGDASKWPQSVG